MSFVELRRLVLLIMVIGACGPAASVPTPTPPSRSATATPPAVTASVTPTVTPITVSPAPATTRVVLSDASYSGAGPALLFQSPGDDRLRAVAWDGAANGVLKAQVPSASLYPPWTQSPDGSRYVVGAIAYDRDGRAVGALPWTKDQFRWATDGRFACAAAHPPPSVGGPMRLETAIPGQQPRVVATGYATYSDNAGYPVLACDARADRAIVGVFGQGLFGGGYWVFQLSTGAVVRAWKIGPGAVGAWLTASDDGLVIAESVQPAAGAPTTTTVRRADDGVALATVPDFEAHGFSGDGTLLFGYAGPTKRAMQIVDWKSGRVVWSVTGYFYGGFLVEPGGTRIAVAGALTNTMIDQDVYLVAPDGTSVLLPKGARTTFRY